VRRRPFAAFLPLLPWLFLLSSIGAFPRPGRDHKLIGRVQGTRGWDESPTFELIDYLVKAPAR
jgi:hypothetical protein